MDSRQLKGKNGGKNDASEFSSRIACEVARRRGPPAFLGNDMKTKDFKSLFFETM